jgi:hypothetical protein
MTLVEQSNLNDGDQSEPPLPEEHADMDQITG